MCRGVESRPVRYNRPGLKEISYRLDTHAGFMRRMLNGLYLEKTPGESIKDSPLRALNTQSTEDPAVALLDAWSLVADVLTFYQERIANEGFLRTATERLSVLELARFLGYEVRPGVSASAFLVFNVDNALSTPHTVEVPANTRVQSIPMPGDQPKTFETRNSFKSRTEWNLLRPKLTRAQNIVAGTRKLLIKGMGFGLSPGDTILLIDEERERDPESNAWDIRVLDNAIPYPEKDATWVAWTEPLKKTMKPKVFVLRDSTGLFGCNSPDVRAKLQEIEHKNSLEDSDPHLKIALYRRIIAGRFG